MKISPLFRDLYVSYQAEIDDLQQDSSGADVLKQRLQKKQQQIDALLPMISFSTEMVAAAFHGEFTFLKAPIWEKISACDESSLPSWASLVSSVRLAPWTSKVLPKILAYTGGEVFFIKTCVLEFLLSQHARVATPVEAEYDDDTEQIDGEHLSDEYDINEESVDGEDKDLGDAGSDWLEQQGFDTRKG
jgi:hypothetical protein